MVSNRYPDLLGRAYRPHYSGSKEVRMVWNDGSQTLLDEGQGQQDLRDVHSNPEFYDKGIDLILNQPNAQKKTIDLKVDSYIGSDPSRKIRGLCNPDSGFILLETISKLQYDRSRKVSTNGTLPVRQKADVPGWFFTSSADEVYYYFLALLNT